MRVLYGTGLLRMKKVVVVSSTSGRRASPKCFDLFVLER
jgi:hypothetical protein